jgi:predicted RNA binding protein YcfA (HicA-like mRNA interferase family)
MPHQVDRRTLTKWLTDHGFSERSGKKTGHLQFVKSGVVITMQSHGPQDLSKKHVGMILRQLERIGYDRDTVRSELESREW